MAYSTAEFLVLLQDLMPVGPIWPRDAFALETQTLGVLAPTWGRLAGRDDNLLVDAFPATTLELLPEWELSTGLPDPCAGESPTIEQRRAQVLARFASPGGQSVAYLISYAATLGYAITITQFRAFRVGDRVGQPLYGTQWNHAWQVNAAALTATYFRAGESAVGEHLVSYGNTVMQCELNRIKPAHTALIFNYAS